MEKLVPTTETAVNYMPSAQAKDAKSEHPPNSDPAQEIRDRISSALTAFFEAHSERS